VPGPGRPIETPREVFVQAASSLLEGEGRSGFSLRRLAGATGHSTSAVYTHFGSASEVLDAVAVAYLEATEYPSPTGDPLVDLEDFVVDDLRRALDHPELAALVVERRPVIDASIRAGEYLRGLLRRAGVGPRMMETVLSTLGLLTLGAFASVEGQSGEVFLRRFRSNVRLVLDGVGAGLA
jgi:AcrR family transcriptional regulator